MAVKEFDKFRNDPVYRDIAERCEKFLLDCASSRNTEIRHARAEGETIGIAKGEKIGIVKGKLETLTLILTKRLGPLPEELSAKLQTMTDIAEIDRISDIALDIPSWEEFAKKF